MLTCGVCGAVLGQDTGRSYTADEWRWIGSGATEDAAFLAANALVVGLGVGLVRKLRGGPFLSSAARASMGGAVEFLGKRTAAMDFGGSGLLGRTINAAGASVADNVMMGRGSFDVLHLPIGPAYATIRRSGSDRRVTWGVDVASLAYAMYGAFDSALSFDWRESFSSGAPVFKVDRRHAYNGRVFPGVIVVNTRADEPTFDVIQHERTHLLQQDMLHILVGTHLEAAIRNGDPPGQAPGRFDWTSGLDRLGVLYLLGSGWLPRAWSPVEVEATYLEIR